MEKYRERKNDLHMVFIDLEKTYSVSRNIISDSLKTKCILRTYIETIRDMFMDSQQALKHQLGQ